MVEFNGHYLNQDDLGDLRCVFFSARNVLASDSKAHVLGHWTALELLDRAISELSISSPNFEFVRGALLVAYSDLSQVPNASDIQQKLQTVERLFFDLKLP